MKWIPARENYLLPVKVLGKLFRGKFLAALDTAYRDGRLDLEGSFTELSAPDEWHRFKNALYEKNWVVYAKPPFGGAEQVFRRECIARSASCRKGKYIMNCRWSYNRFRKRQSPDSDGIRLLAAQISISFFADVENAASFKTRFVCDYGVATSPYSPKLPPRFL